MESFNVGETVKCDLDGRTYKIVWIKDRNEIEKSNPDKPPKLVGNVIKLEDSEGNTVHAYDWEISKIH